jgi:hypothetical protein
MSQTILEQKMETIPSNAYLLEEVSKIRKALKQLKNLKEKTLPTTKAKRKPVKRRAVVKRKAATKRKPVKRRAVVKRKAARRRK